MHIPNIIGSDHSLVAIHAMRAEHNALVDSQKTL